MRSIKLAMRKDKNQAAAKHPPFFPASYLLMTVTSLFLLAALGGLGAILIDYWFNGTSGILAEFNMIYLLASLIVVLPVHLWAYLQVRRTDRSQVTTFSLRVAHALLGLYLFAVIASAIVLGTWLVAGWLNVWLGAGSVTTHLVASTLALAQAIAWLVYAVMHFTRVRADAARARYYVATVGVVSLALIMLSLVFPVPAYREVARDLTKANDLSDIQHAIDGYVDANGKLPPSLDGLEGTLSQETMNRLGDYTYESHGGTNLGIYGYSLCATFAKSSGEARDTGFGFASHGSGQQCFARTSISGEQLREGLNHYVRDVENGASKLQTALAGFMQTAGKDVTQLESHLEGLEGGTQALQREMQRLEGDLTGLQTNTGDLNQDFQAIEKFFHDLGCLFSGC
jgi:type II secretory pathway pseudopilin PulG